MSYYYMNYKRLFYLSFIWLIVSIVLRYKELSVFFNGKYTYLTIIALLIHFVVTPACFVVTGFYLKSISIKTDSAVIVYKSYFKTLSSSWNDIQIVERYGSRVKITTVSGTFTYQSKIGMDPKELRTADNIFKCSRLLQEIHTNATKAEFRNFPENTF